MDIEFIVQDVFALTRPQWKLASNIEEASKAFQLAVAQDQKTSGLDKAAEPEEADSEGSSDDGLDDADAEAEAEAEAEAGLAEADADAEKEFESDDEADVSYTVSSCSQLATNINTRLTQMAMQIPQLQEPTLKKSLLLSLDRKNKWILRTRLTLSVSMQR